MKKIYIFAAFILLIFPRNCYSKAQCPAGLTQSECCSQDSGGATLTQAECSSNCTGTCSSTDAYYAGCYKCSTGLTKDLSLQLIDSVDSAADSELQLIDTTLTLTTKTETVSSCPKEMLLSSDGCCCVNN